MAIEKEKPTYNKVKLELTDKTTSKVNYLSNVLEKSEATIIAQAITFYFDILMKFKGLENNEYHTNMYIEDSAFEKLNND